VRDGTGAGPVRYPTVIVATRGRQFIDLIGEVDGTQYGVLYDLSDPSRVSGLWRFQTVLAQGGWVECDEEWFEHEESDLGVTVNRSWEPVPWLTLTPEQVQNLR